MRILLPLGFLRKKRNVLDFMASITLNEDLGNTKVLVTGAGGLVGHAVCDLLYQKRIPFIGVYRSPTEKKKWDCRVGDIAKENLDKLLTDVNISSVIHCAALIPNVNHSFEECFQVNTAIDLKVAKYIRDYNVGRLVFLSTTNIYGGNDHIIDEDSPLKIDNLYGEAKANSEILFSSIPNTITISLRINAPYHYTQKNDTVLKLFINSILNDRDILYHGSGIRQQDFTYISDVASAVVSSLKNGSLGPYNIAGDNPISMKDLAELILSKVPGSRSKIFRSGFPDLQENQKAFFNISKAKRELAWEPLMELNEGIDEWIKYLTK